MVEIIDTEKVMQQTIFSYISENVWNTPLQECRRNIILKSYNKGRAAINTVDLGCESVDLPFKSTLTINLLLRCILAFVIMLLPFSKA